LRVFISCSGVLLQQLQEDVDALKNLGKDFKNTETSTCRISSLKYNQELYQN